jgi:cadmium resistance protein CadD (predicted permease)
MSCRVNGGLLPIGIGIKKLLDHENEEEEIEEAKEKLEKRKH